MKAVYCTKYGAPDVLEVKEISIPQPKENEILIKNHASSITTADTIMRTGTPWFTRLFMGFSKPKKPIMGTGYAGQVIGLGANVKTYQPGDRVYGETTFCFGANAEYVCVDVDKSIIKSIPTSLKYEEAAPICDGLLTSYNLLIDKASLKPNQHVLIIGASGSVGSAAIQIAKNIGAEVTAVCSETNAEMVRELGADHHLDYNKDDYTHNLNCYDVVYDTVGKSSFAKAKNSLKTRGIYLSPVLTLTLLGQMLLTAKTKRKKAQFYATGLEAPKVLNHFLDKLKPFIEMGKIRTVIDRRYSIEEISDAHAYIHTGRKKGNVVLVHSQALYS
ncbi:NAD(P)-dependent alcohol dehydrogenase [Carboxylicivirga sp. N1Y90]|uniref:NAD(P)-dependent alcohol dehydrogenase n=1 Tax=Carboxylicivirga fragile TaxID=3417571 RepID=UPI003D34FB5E|nr:NAD(P)-dependent alcohol dehydrogenase [Marinilabiliaceae bacterium N1Y90]